MRILLAVDNSAKSERAIEELLALNVPKGGKLRIVTATELPVMIPPLNPSMARAGIILEALQKQAKLRVESAADKLRLKLAPDQCEIETEVLLGSPVQAVVEEATRWRADLLIIGSHLYSALERWLIGSDSLSIALAVPCDVYIARRQKHDFF